MSAAVAPAVSYDPRDPAVIADPYPILRQLQDQEPVHWSDVLGGWVVTRFDHVKAALHNARLSSDRVRPGLDHLAGPERARLHTLGEVLGGWAVFVDPPAHTRLRGLMNKAFTSRALDALRPRIAALVDRFIDQLHDQRDASGQVDFVRALAYPLPATVIAEMIGVPAAYLDRFRAWSDDLAAFVGFALTDGPDRRAQALRGACELADYFADIIAERRRRPPRTRALIDDLIAAEQQGERLSASELVSCCVLLLFAGHETTTNVLANGLYSLLRHPDQLARFVADPRGLASSTVEELLRYEGPIGAMTRVVREPWTVPGTDRTLAPGHRVYAMIHAANRDPRRFADPDRLDVGRADNRHIAFGHGIHFCLGAPLARMEAHLAFSALIRRVPAIELAREIFWKPSLILRGVASLTIRF